MLVREEWVLLGSQDKQVEDHFGLYLQTIFLFLAKPASTAKPVFFKKKKKKKKKKHVSLDLLNQAISFKLKNRILQVRVLGFIGNIKYEVPQWKY